MLRAHCFINTVYSLFVHRVFAASPFYSEYQFSCTLANSEDSDEMPPTLANSEDSDEMPPGVAFLQGLHCCQDKYNLQGQNYIPDLLYQYVWDNPLE